MQYIPAKDSVHGQPFTTHAHQCRNDTGGLSLILHVEIGAIVMLTVNLDVSAGLYGAIGMIKSIIKKS